MGSFMMNIQKIRHKGMASFMVNLQNSMDRFMMNLQTMGSNIMELFSFLYIAASHTAHVHY